MKLPVGDGGIDLAVVEQRRREKLMARDQFRNRGSADPDAVGVGGLCELRERHGSAH